jgi:penicillin-insensitive murein endopeptidase
MRSILLASLGLLLASGTARGEESAAVTKLATNTYQYTQDLRPSLSCGSTNRGALGDAARLPNSGPGFVMAEPWRSRGSNFGTTELVSLIQRSSAAVALAHDGSQLSVADLSKKHGGAIAAHRSHQNGRDVDLIYYAMDANGDPFYPDSHMAYYTSSGQATYAKAPNFVSDIPVRYFDMKRNWSLIRNMMLDTEVDVEFIFVSTRVKRWLLAYAAEIQESPAMLKAAIKILHAPRDVKGHNDHMHVRIACSAEDAALGTCRTASARKPRRAKKWNRIMACPSTGTAPLAMPARPVLPPLYETTD